MRRQTKTDEKDEKNRKRPREKGTGTIFKPKGSSFWWIAYMSGGKRRYESTKSVLKGAAVNLLMSRLGDNQRGIVVTPKIGKITCGVGLTAVVSDLKINGRKSDAETRRRIDLHVLKHFSPERRMNTITTADIEAYKAARMDEKAKPATINRELAALRRAFRLAIRGGELTTMPHVGLLQEHNVRTGFFERDAFESVIAHLPDYLRAPIRFLYVTGWRLKSEVLPLTVDRVDLQAGTVRLDPGTTKSGAGRTFYLTADLRKLLEEQLASIERLRKRDFIVPYVFHRPDGTRLRDFRKAWQKACEAAGYPGKLFHDFRRTAVRNLERAAVPRSTAKAMVGHKTDAIYSRYAIVDEAMHLEATAKLDAWALLEKAKSVESKKRLRQFKRKAS